MRRKTRRGGVLSEPQQIIRQKQIENVQKQRFEDIKDFRKEVIKTNPGLGRTNDRHRLLKAMLYKIEKDDARLRSKGKGRKTRRRTL